jgi:hypothetical protein
MGLCSTWSRERSSGVCESNRAGKSLPRMLERKEGRKERCCVSGNELCKGVACRHPWGWDDGCWCSRTIGSLSQGKQAVEYQEEDALW